MLNADDNEYGFKTNRCNQQKKPNCTCSTLFLLISKKKFARAARFFVFPLLLFCTTTTLFCTAFLPMVLRCARRARELRYYWRNIFTAFAVGLSGQNEAKFQKNLELFSSLPSIFRYCFRKRDEKHSLTRHHEKMNFFFLRHSMNTCANIFLFFELSISFSDLCSFPGYLESLLYGSNNNAWH